MTEISEKQRISAPLASADRLLRAFFAAHPGPEGAARVVLHARDLQRPAVVTLTPAHRPGDMTPHYTVRWEAEGGGPYPVFRGELTVGAPLPAPPPLRRVGAARPCFGACCASRLLPR